MASYTKNHNHSQRQPRQFRCHLARLRPDEDGCRRIPRQVRGIVIDTLIKHTCSKLERGLEHLASGSEERTDESRMAHKLIQTGVILLTVHGAESINRPEGLEIEIVGEVRPGQMVENSLGMRLPASPEVAAYSTIERLKQFVECVKRYSDFVIAVLAAASRAESNSKKGLLLVTQEDVPVEPVNPAWRDAMVFIFGEDMFFLHEALQRMVDEAEAIDEEESEDFEFAAEPVEDNEDIVLLEGNDNDVFVEALNEGFEEQGA